MSFCIDCGTEKQWHSIGGKLGEQMCPYCNPWIKETPAAPVSAHSEWADRMSNEPERPSRLVIGGDAGPFERATPVSAGPIRYKNCPNCKTDNFTSRLACTECDFAFEPERPSEQNGFERDVVQAWINETKPSESADEARDRMAQKHNDKLGAISREKGFKAGWDAALEWAKGKKQ